MATADSTHKFCRRSCHHAVHLCAVTRPRSQRSPCLERRRYGRPPRRHPDPHCCLSLDRSRNCRGANRALAHYQYAFNFGLLLLQLLRVWCAHGANFSRASTFPHYVAAEHPTGWSTSTTYDRRLDRWFTHRRLGHAPYGPLLRLTTARGLEITTALVQQTLRERLHERFDPRTVRDLLHAIEQGLESVKKLRQEDAAAVNASYEEGMRVGCLYCLASFLVALGLAGTGCSVFLIRFSLLLTLLKLSSGRDA